MIEKFIDYIIGDEDEKEFDSSLPFGGLKKEAPDEAREAYELFVKDEKEAEEKGIKI